jgi:hypothetical protein
MRYRLSTLLIVVIAFSMALGIYRHRAEVQKRAVRTISGKVWSVAYQGVLFDQLPDYVAPYESRDPNYPTWLLDRFGRDYVGTVIAVSISDDYRDNLRYERGEDQSKIGPRVNPWYPDPEPEEMIDVQDGTVEHLASLRGLIVLDLAETNVTDENLAQLSRLSNLRHVRLGNAVTKSGVDQLQRVLPEAVIEY